MNLLVAMMLALAAAMFFTMGRTAGVPLGTLPRALRRRMRPTEELYRARYPRPLVWAYLRFGKWKFKTQRTLKYRYFEACALALSLYSGLTRQKGFEGFRMAYWRWLACIHLAIK